MNKVILVILLILFQQCFAVNRKQSHSKKSKSVSRQKVKKEPDITSLKIFPIKLKLSDKGPSSFWLFSAEQKYTGPKELADLAFIRQASLDRKFGLCSQMALVAFSKPIFDDLKPWIAHEGLDCFNLMISSSGGSRLGSKDLFDIKLAKKWLDRLVVSPGLFFKEPTQSLLSNQYNKFLLNAIRESQNPYRPAFIQEALSRRNRLGNDIKSEVYTAIADVALKEQQPEAASYYLQKINSSIAPQSPQSSPVPEKHPESILSNIIKFIFKTTSSPEEDLWQKFQDHIKKNNVSLAAKFGVDLLNEYPGGAHSSFVSEKLINIYLSNMESSKLKGDEKEDFSRSILSYFVKADPSRIFEWIKVLHRRQDYFGAHYLGKKIISEQENASSTGIVLFLAGRSAQFLGMYKEALKMFDQLIERYGGMDESLEARFRAALIHLRLEHWDRAEEYFWGVISNPQNKNYELASYYWLYRIYEKTNRNTKDLFNLIQQKYSLSYYGLKLLAEKNQGRIRWKKQPLPNVDMTIWLTEAEKLSFDRANKLSQVGWFNSAQLEVNDLINPVDADTKVVLARYFSHLFNYPAAIKLLTEAGNLNDVFKEPSVVEIGFPFPFKSFIEREAQANNLSPWLVVSLIRQESAFSLKAQSTSQAQGLMQLIGPTAKEVAEDLKLNGFQESDIYEPSTNIRFGSYYLSKVTKQFANNVSLGLAAYNAGPFRLKKFLEIREEVKDPSKLSQEDPWSDLWIEELPWLETNIYVKSILRNLIIYQLLEKEEVDVPRPVWKI